MSGCNESATDWGPCPNGKPHRITKFPYVRGLFKCPHCEEEVMAVRIVRSQQPPRPIHPVTCIWQDKAYSPAELKKRVDMLQEQLSRVEPQPDDNYSIRGLRLGQVQTIISTLEEFCPNSQAHLIAQLRITLKELENGTVSDSAEGEVPGSQGDE